MKRFYFSKCECIPLGLVILIFLLGMSPGGYAQSATFTWNGTGGVGSAGSVQTYTVPTGVSSLGIDMEGGCGGGFYNGTTTAGAVALAGRVQCNLTVSSGEVLYINVGGMGQNMSTSGPVLGGWNGGQNSTSSWAAGSGGSTDIRTCNCTATGTNRLVVAGGGGGGGDWNSYGGLGGGLTGGSPGPNSNDGGAVATGGTQTSGGTGTTGNAGTYVMGGAPEATFSEAGGGGGYWGGHSGSNVGATYSGIGGGGGSSYTDPVLGTAVTHTQGYSGANGNGRVIITVLCGATGTIAGTSSVLCTGATVALTDPTGATAGTWSSSNTGVATINPSTGVTYGVVPGITTITYTVPNPCGGVAALATASVTVYQAASITSGTSRLCTGQATTITVAPGGGVWSSSNTAAATVVSSGGTTGAATGAAVGTGTIIYTLSSGCVASDPVTVGLSPNYHTVTVTGTGGYCAGNPIVHIGLDGSNTGISYSLTSGGVVAGTVAGTGSPLDFGLITAPGTYNVIASYPPPAGCSLTMTGAANVFLNPNPTLTAGTASTVCVGSSIGLGASPAAGTWASNNIATASVNPSSGVVAGIAPGAASISYTLAGGCSVNKVITVNATPVAIAGATSVCTGSTISLSNATTGGTWSSSSPSVAAVGIGTGVVSGVSAGAPNITYSLGTGCYATEPVIVNLLPTAYSITGGGPYCAGAGVHVGLSYASSGINYTLYNGGTLIASLTGAGSSLDYGLQYTAGTYTVFASNPVTGCSSTMAGSALVSINPLPNSTYVVAGGGNYCSGGTGVAISLSNSDFGTSYQLINGGPVGSAVAGAGGPIGFGMQTGAGTYTVLATTGAGCMATMTGNAVISINSSPTPYTISGGGVYCIDGTGSDITLGGSDIGTNYQLYDGSSMAGGSIPGSGSSIDFGPQTATGNYTVVATNAAGCSGSMVGNAVVMTISLPTPYSVTPPIRNYCIGGVLVGLSFSDPGVNYQLYYGGVPTGIIVAGSSASINFGLQTASGVYTVVATNVVTGCTGNMSGSSLITESTPPVAYPVTGSGQYCAGGTGVNVGLSTSSGGVSYQLYNGGVPSGRAITGTGSALNFGLQTAGAYTIIATNTATGCTNTMLGSALISTVALPTSYSISTATPGSSYCQGGAGVDILLNGSDLGTNYQLYKGTLPVGTSVPGTSYGLDFGYSMLPGVYTIVASNPGTTCSSTMSGNIPVTINPLPNIYTVTGGGNFCAGAPGAHVGLSGSNTGMNYQLYLNSLPITGAVLAGTGVSLDFGYQSATGTYTAVATNTTTFCNNNMVGSPVVVANALPDTFSLTGDGTSYCASASGSPVGLISSVPGISYQLYNGSATSGAAVAGSGAPINFGNHTAGTYTVVAKNSATGCTNNMPGSATISVNPVPAAFTVNGGGNACSAGTGTPVGLGGSVTGINYQLYYGGLPTATTVTGTGSAISFGSQTGGGTYTAVGIDPASSCTSNMTGSVVITVIPSPPVSTVTGGGPYCAGGAGVHVDLAGTAPGVTYQLSNGGTAVGSVVTGTGAPIDFGLQTAPGTYIVVASPGGACQTNMTGSAVIVVNPLPVVYTVTGGGNICAGTTTGYPINLSGSSSGTTYQLFNGSTLDTSITGLGSPLVFGPLTSAGAYSVIATSAAGCTNTMAGSGSTLIVVSALPHAYNMMGGGDYCSGGAGVHVELAGSGTDVDYQLFNGSSAVGAVLVGSGTELDFGLQTAAGTYTAVATDLYTHCTNNMADMAIVSVDPILTPAITISSDPTGNILAGQSVILTAHVVGNAGTSPAFQWYVNGLPADGATDSSYISNKFSNGDSVSCTVTASGMCAGNPASNYKKLTISGEGVQQVTSSGSNISLLPNPNKGMFTIKGTLGVTDDEEVSIEITDMVGHAIYTDKVMSRNGSINENISLSSSLANGMYLVNVRSASASQVFHMVIEE